VLTWLGFSAERMLCAMDSAGVLSGVTPVLGWGVTPLLQTKTVGKLLFVFRFWIANTCVVAQVRGAHTAQCGVGSVSQQHRTMYAACMLQQCARVAPHSWLSQLVRMHTATASSGKSHAAAALL
jgi:hypothetical protein